MIAPLAQHGEDCGAALSLHLSSLSSRDLRVLVVDQTPYGWALAWPAQRSRENLPCRFGVLGLAREMPNQEPLEIARDAARVGFDGSPRVAAIARSSPLAADVLLVAVTPSPFNSWALAEMLWLSTPRTIRLHLAARFVLHCCAARTANARETGRVPPDHDPLVLASPAGQRIAFAGAANTGSVGQLDASRAGSRDHRARWRRRRMRGMTASDILRVLLECEFPPTAAGGGAAP